VTRRVLDGRILKLGNRASFLEPLEATAITLTHLLLEQALQFPLGEWASNKENRMCKQSSLASRHTTVFNDWYYRHVLRASLFLGWHYGYGSRYETAFWEKARAGYIRAREAFPEPGLVEELDKCFEYAQHFEDIEAFTAARPKYDAYQKFCVWNVESFIQAKNGIQ